MKKHLLIFLSLCLFTAAQAKRTGMFLFFDLPQKHMYEDDHVRVVIAFDGTAKLVIYNKTGNVIYVDKENTFAYVNNNPDNLFKNQVQTTQHSTNSGASVNLGSVASALGIGGALGTLANGVNVGGGNGNTSGTYTYEKRILSVAPGATAILYEWNTVENLKNARYIKESGWLGSNGYFLSPHKEIYKKGMQRHFSTGDTPLYYKAVVRYSTQENFETFQQATIDNYLVHIVIDSYKGVKDNQYREHSVPFCSNFPYTAAVVGEGDYHSWLMGALGVEFVGLGLMLLILL